MTMDKKDFYARTMHTPDSPERAELRAALRETSKALLPLHRQLIDVAKLDFAIATASRVPAPAQLLQLLTDDPYFAWLKPLTALIVDIDEMARTDFEAADAFAISDRLESLFTAGGDASFNERYTDVLQRDVEVAGGHAALRKAAARLRKPRV
jgi:hypothetical protein